MTSRLPQFRGHYSAGAFWKKARRYARKAGLNLIYSVLVLYYAARRPITPAWARKTIYGALGYFVFPADAYPDWMRGGYTDDIAVIAMHIDDEVKAKAQKKLRDWFGGAARGASLLS